MAAISQPARRSLLLPRLKALVTLQKFNQTLAGDGVQLESAADRAADSNFQPGQIEFSNWRKLDARCFGITGSKISSSSWTVLNVLKKKGFKAYLVGGCVRDLILNRIPKDFDVITTAQLNQIKKQFRRAEIVGRRFPICRVHIRGSIVEVSSFDTVANKGDETKRKNFFVPGMPKGCNENDVIRWRNSLHRDFTINSSRISNVVMAMKNPDGNSGWMKQIAMAKEGNRLLEATSCGGGLEGGTDHEA